MKRYFSTLIFSLLTIFSFSQEEFEGGVILGYSNYLGDLVEPSFTFDQANPAIGIWLRYDASNRFNLRSSLIFGKLEGDDANYTNNILRAASFESPYIEGALVGELEIFGKRAPMNKVGFGKSISPYLFAGIGLGIYNTDASFGSSSAEINLDKSADYLDYHFSLPVGAGFKMNINESVSIGAELSMRLLFTDYLDGVSKAGNPDNNDAYVVGGINIGYTFGTNDLDKDGIVNKKDRCPEHPGPIQFDGCPDSDGDGIVDREDECPMKAGTVRLNGCPDRDEDGIADKNDDCPDDAGIRRFGGCPDTDNDGIVDLEDVCPTEAGIPSLNGCPDSDRDGVTDKKDECPLQAGPVLLNGCPDIDKDGIPDNKDQCPDQPGTLVNNGCPDLDTDGDGIIDRKDQCPTLAGLLENNGCPEIKQEDQVVLNYAMSNVEFETGSNELTPASLEILNQIIAILKKYKGYRLRINGHTDDIGEADKNLLLSEDRAKACYNYLFLNGVDPLYITYGGYGESLPIADNKTKEGRRQNRRVEFILTTEEF